MRSTLAIIGAYLALAIHAQQTSDTASRPAPTGLELYISQVCTPKVTDNSGTLPPCISITNIETQCKPNGTSPLDYLASAQCLCSPPSTFFADWLGCRQCLYYHGALTQQDLGSYSVILSSVSNALCTGTPTAEFATYFTNIAGDVPRVTTGGTVSSDQGPSQTAVSLYYTAPASQGPGSITGSATGATGSGSAAATTATGSGRTSGAVITTGTGSSSSRATTGSTSGSSTGSAAAAAPTLLDGRGVIAAVAGGAMLLAL